MVKISIIMPVYNAEDYLEETLKSVLNQTIDDIELICINDGSVDNSLEILNNLKEQYNFIKVYTIENQGSGKARNYGIEKATGEYIAFLDADDSFIDKSALESMYMYGNRNDANIVCGNLQRITKNRNIEKNYNQQNTRFAYFSKKDVLEPIEYGIPWAFYKNIYKTSFIQEKNIKFPDLIRGQDPIFLANVLTNVEQIYVVKTDLYGYNHSVGGGVNIKLNDYDKKYAYIQHFKDTFDILEKAGFETPLNEYKKEFINYIKFQQNLYDNEIKEIIPKVFENIDHYFNKDDENYFYLDLLNNPQISEELDEFKLIKKCLFEESLISDNFIGYDRLKEYVEYKKQNNIQEKDIKKASYNALKSIEDDVQNENEVLTKTIEEIDENIYSTNKSIDSILTSKSWKATKLLRDIKNRNTK